MLSVAFLGRGRSRLAVVVDTTVVTVTTVPTTLSGSAGDTPTLFAIARNAAGMTLGGKTFTAVSSDTGVATVSVVGNTVTVTFVAGGSCTITVTCETVSAIAVTGTVTAGTGVTGGIPLTLRALDLTTAYSGTASYGVFLLEGEHMPAADVTVGVEGTEVNAYVEDLAGRHPDGSVVAILVQHAVAIGAAGSVASAVVLGRTPTLTAMAQDTVARKTNPDVTALPAKARSAAAWPLWTILPAGTTCGVTAVDDANTKLDRVLKGIAKRPWSGGPAITYSPAGRGNGADKYDGALVTMHAAMRFGGADTYQWGHYFLGDALTQAASAEAAVRTAGYVPTEYSFNNSADYWAHAYWLTGAELYRTMAGALANHWTVDVSPTYLSDGVDGRRWSKGFASALCALACEASYGGVDYGPSGYATVIDGTNAVRASLSKLVTEQRPANDGYSNTGQPNDYTASGTGATIGGGFWSYGPNTSTGDMTSTANGTPEGDRYKVENYMVGMLMYESGRLCDWLDARSLIPSGEVTALVTVHRKARAWMNLFAYTPAANYPPGPIYEKYRDGTTSPTTGDVSWFPVTWPWLFYAWLEQHGINGAILEAQAQYVALVGQVIDNPLVNVDVAPYDYGDWVFPTGGGRGDFDPVGLNGTLSNLLPLAAGLTVVGAADTTVTTVVASPSSVSTAVGTPADVTATAKNAAGIALSGKTFTAVSSDTGVATVSVAGSTITVTPVAAGSCTVTVTCEGVSATVATTVSAGAAAGTYFAFRSTLGFVTDPTGEVAVLLENSPTTRGGYTFGYTPTSGSVNAADVDAGNPTMLAGYHYIQNTGGGVAPRDWILDLTPFGGPGTYKIGLALGAPNVAEPEQYVEVLDDTTSRFAATGASGMNTFVDATGTARAAASWASGQAYQSGVTFATSTLRLTIGDPAGSGYTSLACLYVERTGP